MQLMVYLWLAFLTGLTTGGVSCLAVQGGLLATSLSVQTNDTNGRRLGILIFLLSKLIAYTLLGFFLGALGSVIMLRPIAFGIVQIVAGLIMLASAARIVDIHPIFRYFVFQPPRWVYRFLKHTGRNSSQLSSFVLGFFTILMPCGVTQATMAAAVASGSALIGAGIMCAFVLGTSPVFFILGATIAELMQRKAFVIVAAIIIAVFGIFSINGGLGVMGSIYTIQNFYTAATTPLDKLSTFRNKNIIIDADGFQEVLVEVGSQGYRTSTSVLKAGIPVRLTLITDNTKGCSRAFTIPGLNISRILPETGQEVIEFIPTEVGRLPFSCSMGMYTGQFYVE